MNYRQEKIKKCKCGKILWKWIDDDTIEIQGANGQDYQISFNFVELVCKNCGQRIYVQSDTADVIEDLFAKTNRKSIKSVAVMPYPYTLPAFERNALLNKLTEKQKKIYSILVEETKGRVNEEEIAKKVGLSKEITHRHIKTITEEIKKIKPNFDKRGLDITSW